MFSDYYIPKTIKDSLEAAKEYGEEACYLAGGTDLVLKMRMSRISPKAVIDLSHIDELAKIKQTDSEILLGAMVRLTDISKLSLSLNAVDVVCRAASHVSSIQVRNMATLGGNTCNASPSADTVPALIVLDAQACIAGFSGVRRVEQEDFFIGPGKTQLKEGELLTAFAIPIDNKDKSAADYQKFTIRGDSDIAIIGVAAKLNINNEGIVTNARIALGAVAPTPIRAKNAERLLIGQKPDKKLISEAAQLAAKEAKPIDDQRASKEYRIKMVRANTALALENCLKRMHITVS